MAFAAIWGVIIEASLSFVGFGNPNNISWGMMLRQVYSQGYITRAWWWVIGPAFALWLFIWALFVTARALEENTEIDASQRMSGETKSDTRQ
jgi:peptide/nickel transport system permease protein